MKFQAFLQRLRFKPTAAQARYAAVAFDGEASPADELGSALFGGPVEAGAHDVIATVKGARVGGTLLAAYRLLHLALTCRLPPLAPGEVAAGILVAPDLRLARQALRYVAGALEDPALRPFVVNETSDAVTVRREDGRAVSIECLPATRGGSALRGRTLVGAVLSEAAFFRNEDYVVNDAEIFRAVSPRVVDGGQVIMESTPWAEAGLLFELFTTHYGSPGRTLAVHAPTLTLRPTPKMRALVEAERKRDPDNASREFDAQFLTAGTGLFFDPAALDRCVSSELVVPCAAPAGWSSYAGADWGFESDSSALVVASGLRSGADRYVVVHGIEERRPSRGAPLKPSEVTRDFADVTRQLKCRSIMSDAHYRQAIIEHLKPHGVSLEDAPAGREGKVAVHLRARELVNAGRLQLPNHPRLLAQLKAIVSKPQPGGGLAISSPRRGGQGHGDVASAALLAIWQASGGDTKRGIDYGAAFAALNATGRNLLGDGPVRIG